MSFTPIDLTFPILAVPKGRPRVFRSGVVKTPDKTVNFEAELRFHWNLTLLPMLPRVPTFVEVICYLPMPKSLAKKKDPPIWPVTKPDTDNLIKGILDSLNGFAWKDDSQVAKHSIEKRYTKESPSLRLRIIPMEAA